ncbi:3-deoxy-D-arabinoheptulosonate-7-phosphate synthase [Peptoclostridium litorale DSM 5388]|uniref:Phospho-2-dehydro-3-deoxyheptonate aldolase AroF n=1 Tax=Peptoclostridium litorale DSM 5388 TaxID=1121324 RepID=A0A069RJT6_PEPLI|nr:3-deoxy-7-phosphoheptulonate synthase [Peptoclostridium litorale]KDR94497.1 phospho-2-dehydro-3-deoxyheptonate aldolase AroF [Peptoclostridium litorale DSM 5388]SIO35734.1 3-deoxy-D-arabinoheptulosonate-7-phosphate synthase [Peptoclostridium litorale DSM 5388]
MVIVMRAGTKREDIDKIRNKMESLGCKVHEVQGESYHILGLVGDTSNIDRELINSNKNVEKVVNIQEPYKKANKMFKPEDTIVEVAGRKIGGGHIGIIAGPCSVEGIEQIVGIARDVKAAGAGFLRGGAFKPRTSPYSFQGLREEGLKLLEEAKKETGLPIVTEIMSASHLEIFEEHVDVMQIGARNMQNFELLKEVGRSKKPVLLKRGMSSSIEELIMSAEYIMAGGNENVILCERGIRTFENFTRNTLDLSAIPAIKKLSHLPVVVDPSHAAGLSWMVEPLSKAAIAVGADGLMIEVHNDPANAKCDGQQSLTPDQFKDLMKSIKQIAQIENKTISI